MGSTSLQETKAREQQLQQMAMKFQMEAMALKGSSKQVESELQQQLKAVREELQLSNQNTDVMREALQVV